MSSPLSLLTAIAFLASPPDSAVRLELGADLGCELNATLATSLNQQAIHVAMPNAPASWVLSVRKDGGAVDLRLMTSQLALLSSRRLNPTAADCPVLSRAIALLVRSWLEAQLGTAAPAPVVDQPPPVVAKPARQAPRAAAPVVEVAPKIPEPVVVVAEPPAPEIESPAEKATAPPLPPSQEFSVSRPTRLEARTARSLSLMLTGGGALGANDSPVGTARLAVELGFAEPWAISLDAGFQSLRSATNGGTIRASLQWATLSARRAFLSNGITGLHVSLGAQLIRLEATAFGFSTERTTKNVFTGGANAGIEWRQSLAAGLFVLGRVSFQARWPQTFSIEGLGTVLTVPSWGVGVDVGVGWNFF